MQTPPPLAVAGLRIRHHDREVWTPDGVDFELAAGEVLLVLGPSGSGKSTLAMALNGLIPHSLPATLEGEVRVAGELAAERTVAQLSEHVAMVFQDPDAQTVTGTVLDEVCFGPENLLLSVDEVLRRAERALRQVGLWERRGDDPATLSGGGRQRLAIACGLAMESDVLVLDEPTANLDPAGVEEVYKTLGRIVADGNQSIVLIEHNLDAAVSLVDQVLVIDGDGRQMLVGGVQEVLIDHADDLLRLGVWLPVSTLAGIRLRAAGVPIDPLPLTPHDLTSALEAVDLPAPRTLQPVNASDEVVMEARGLTLRRGKTRVLDEVSVQVHAGEFVALVGINGAGKTSLLQALAGVLRAPKRQVNTAGRDPSRADPSEVARHVGFVFQNPEHQFIRGTVAEELAHSLELHGMDEASISDRVDEMLERFGLEEQRDVHPFLLSGGQKRRLSVGTALISGATILVLDEPTYGQDRERAAELLSLLDALHRDGTTVLLATHDLQLVADHATRTIVLQGGRICADGQTHQVLASGALEQAGLRPPPLAAAMRGLSQHPEWRSVTRLDELP